MNSSFKIIPPFPVSSSRSKKKDKEKEILEVFKKVEFVEVVVEMEVFVRRNRARGGGEVRD